MPLFTQTLERRTLATFELPLDKATAADLSDALSAIGKHGIDLATVTLDVDLDRTRQSAPLTLRMACEKVERLTGVSPVTPKAAIEAPAVAKKATVAHPHKTPTPATVAAATHRHQAPATTVVPKSAETPMVEVAAAVVPPFPTHPTAKLPELTIPNAHRLVQHSPSGTYYLHVDGKATSKQANMLVQRVHTAAKSLRRHGQELLIETKLMREHNAVAVTIVKQEPENPAA